MESAQQLANRLREVILNGTWIANTNYQTLLADVHLEMANMKIGSLNTIGQLTFHINYYIDGVNHVFDHGLLEIKDIYSFDMPALETEIDWKMLKKQLFQNAEDLAFHVEKMTPQELDAIFVLEKYGTYRRNIEGMIEHAYYHLGQISLIKKMIIGKSEKMRNRRSVG
ncbi:MAG: DUF1572 domain-containing protein [Saprospiraceae bacterium]|nr:DUF1572 domain-containing protein [Saprospiraceae bacterium]